MARCDGVARHGGEQRGAVMREQRDNDNEETPFWASFFQNSVTQPQTRKFTESDRVYTRFTQNRVYSRVDS